ncbi:HXXEE domain-containing protein [Listeria monocytogenes]|nr:HXXEE domain-containing protein [Listeria monocytogenes]
MLEKWCEKYWLYVLYMLGFLMAILLVVNWNNWSSHSILVCTMTIILPLHVLEEWKLPGGFHYQYNTFFSSDIPNGYPMNRLTDMITNFLAEILFIALIPFSSQSGILMGLLIFCVLEVIVHTVFGISMFKKFREKGKKTIYGVGSVTAYLGFGVLSIFLFVSLTNVTISAVDCFVALLLLLFMFGVLIFLPERLLKNKNNKYAFNSTGYFEKFLKK